MIDEDDVNVIIDFSHKIHVIRYLGDIMLPARLKLRAEVFASETAQEIDFDITFAKIKFWLEMVVSRAVIFSRTNLTAMSMLVNENGQPRVSNPLMVTPYEPTDEHLAVLLQAKMAALSGGTIEFGGVRVAPEDGGLVFTYVGSWRDDLPTMDDWFDVKPYYFELPWWRRDDASSVDVMADGADVSELPAWAYKIDFIEKALRPKNNEPADVVKGAFRPKIISGGRDE